MSVRTLKGWDVTSGALWCYLTHRRDLQVFSVGEAFFVKNSLLLRNSGHKTAAAIDEFDKSEDGVLLKLFLN